MRRAGAGASHLGAVSGHHHSTGPAKDLFLVDKVVAVGTCRSSLAAGEQKKSGDQWTDDHAEKEPTPAGMLLPPCNGSNQYGKPNPDQKDFQTLKLQQSCRHVPVTGYSTRSRPERKPQTLMAPKGLFSCVSTVRQSFVVFTHLPAQLMRHDTYAGVRPSPDWPNLPGCRCT